MSEASGGTGSYRVFSGEDEDALEYKRWKAWTLNKLLTLSDKIAKEARGAFVFTLLQGKALECVEHLDPSTYQCADGEKVLFGLLDKRFPQKDVADELGETLQQVFSLRAADGENLKTWISRATELFDRCRRKTNVDFPSEARGWVVLHRSGLNAEQKAVVLARSLGVLKVDEISRAMRSCYPEFVAKNKSHGVSLVEEPEEDFDLDEGPAADFEDIEAFLADHEPGDAEAEAYPENEVAEILAVSWKDKRKEITKLQQQRRFGEAKEARRRFRVEIEELKRKTRCRKCNQVGHWEKECTSKGRGKSYSKSASKSKSTPSESGAGLVQWEEHFVASVECLTASVRPAPTMIEQLRQRQRQSNPVEALLVSSPGYGILDSGCGKSIIGALTLADFRELWKKSGFVQPESFPEVNHFRYGNDQQETSTQSIKIPVKLAGKTGSIKAAIVKGRTPLLVSRATLRQLKAHIDFGRDELHVFDQILPLETNQAGQYVVSLLGESQPVEAVTFQEVLITDSCPVVNKPIIESEIEEDQAGPVNTVEDHITKDIPKEQSLIWTREDWGLNNTPGVGKNGPPWSTVFRRVVRNGDTNEVLYSEDNIASRSKKEIRKQIPDHVVHTVTEFHHFADCPDRKKPIECLSVKVERQLHSQIRHHLDRKKRPVGEKYMVAEVFSPPRFAPVVQDSGFKAVSFDIKNGWDFTKASVRNQVEQELQKHPPSLLVLCPPCTDEGGWFHLNSCYMTPLEYLQRKARSRVFIRYCARLFKNQVEAGGRAVFEHPSGSRLWTYPEMLALCRKYPVLKLHMCRFGLKLPGSSNFIRKSTKLLVTHSDMESLAKQCPGKTCSKHQCHDVIAGQHPSVGSISQFAGQYTPEFVRAVLETVPEFHLSQPVLMICDETLPEMDSSSVAAVESIRKQVQGSDKSDSHLRSVIDKLHRNLGHPPNCDLVRILKNGQASERAIALARQHSCDFCQSQKQPKVPLPANTQRCTEFNQQVGLDVVYLPGWKPNQKIKALNLVDQASGFQQILPFFEAETSQLLCNLYSDNWKRWAGPPKEIILDPAQTNLGDPLQAPVELDGTMVKTIAAEAHWQLGRTERHGGWFRRVLQKVMEQHSPSTKEEWMECVQHSHVKNQMIQSYGLTPHQFVFGRNPDIPGDLLNEPLHIVPATAGLTDQAIARTQALRSSARQAVLALQDDQSLRRALLARPRVSAEFKPGELVCYWRQQKYQQGQINQQARWYGTAIVIGNVGRNVVIAHRKSIFRCAPEQLRPATNEERCLIETPETELLGIKDLIEGGTFRSKNFVDLVPEHYPTLAPGTADSPIPNADSAPAGISSEVSDQPMVINAEMPPPEVPSSGSVSEPHATSTPSVELGNPMVQSPSEVPRSSTETSSYGPVRRRIHEKAGPMSLWRPAPMQQDDLAEVLREVIPQMIDSATSSLGESRKRALETESSAEEPATTRQCRDNEVLLVEEVDELIAELFDTDSSVEVLLASFLMKKAAKEMHHSGHPPPLQAMIDEAKEKEWTTLASKPAIKIHYGKRAKEIKERYSHRFIGSRFVITRKPIEEGCNVNPEDINSFSAKARWCLQGHLDPDLTEKAQSGMLQSPTLSQMGRTMLMQLLSSNGWDLQLGDIKGAFLEAGPLPDRYRPLYAHQPPGGVPGLPPDSVIEVIGNVYGQNDAPVAWYKTFDASATEIGWHRSKFDPCLYHLRSDDGKSLVGIMGVHVDDTAIGGKGAKFEAAVKALRSRFPYRKWRVREGEFCGAYYRQHADFSINMSQKAFAESLKPAHIAKGTRCDAELTEAQVRVLRAINGSLNWLSSQSRPDLAVQTSLSQQAFPRPRIHNLRDANNAIRRARQNRDLEISFKPIPIDQLTICCHSDAAWANVGTHTQAGYVLAFVDKALQEGEETFWTPFTWRSYKLPRAASSTLSAESQAMATATGTVEWMTLLMLEAIDGPFEPRSARELLQKRPPIMAIDCKSLFDHLISPSSPTSIEDRRTSIDVVIIRESLKLTSGHVRWLPTDRMVADAFTKDKSDPADLLRSCIKAGRYQISEENTVLARQAEERKERLARRQQGQNVSHESV